MLQSFLDHNFIQIKEDENLSKLRKAGGELARKLSKNKAKIISYTLIALDPEVKANNSDLDEAKKIIIKNWKTFVANSGDTPITIIRAVILEALETMSKEKNYACIIWLAGRNVIKHCKLGREGELLTKFLLDLGNKIEKEAVENWSLPSESKIAKLTLKIEELTGATLDKTEIENHLKAAAIHSAWGESGENPYLQTQNNVNWPKFFAERASHGIRSVVNKALKSQAKEISASLSQAQEALNNLLIQTQSEILQKNSLMQIRTQLLWWKEACYSESLKQSYRELKDGLLQVALAIDYSSFVPFIYPTSVDYLLKETHRVFISEEGKRMKISEILKMIKEASEKLKAIFVEHKAKEGRVSLINFVEGLVWNRHETTQLKNLVGISAATEITLDEFTLWLFHDLQALKIASSK